MDAIITFGQKFYPEKTYRVCICVVSLGIEELLGYTILGQIMPDTDDYKNYFLPILTPYHSHSFKTNFWFFIIFFILFFLNGQKESNLFFLLYIFQSSAKSVDKVYLCDHIVLIVENNMLIAAI